MPATYAPSANVAELRESATIAVSARARALRAAGRAVIDLGAGEPDWATPDFVCAAAKRAVDAGLTRYTAVEGILPLREAIAARAREHWRGEPAVTAADVVVTAGTKQALFNACFVLFGAGDEVLVPTPGWTSYFEMLTLARAVPVAVHGERARGLKVSAASLAAAATPRTRGLMLNSPTNPTGAVYGRAELAAILALAEARGWWVVSDEIYRRIAYDAARDVAPNDAAPNDAASDDAAPNDDTPEEAPPVDGAPSVLDVAASRDRLVVVDGVAKAYAMTGWRIGWAVAPTRVARAMTALQSHTTSNASTVSQHAALAALTERAASDAAVARMVAAFRQRRDAAAARLRAAGLEFVEPRGAFYLFVRVGAPTPEHHDPGATVARRLLEEHDVAVVPGSAFGAPEWVRLSYAAPEADVLAGVERLIAVLAGR